MKKIAILAMLLAMIAAGCGSQPSGNSTGTDGNNQGASVGNEGGQKEDPQGEKEPEGEQEPEEEPKEEEVIEEGFQVGETFELKDWEVTVDSFEFDQAVKDGMFSSSAAEGSKFLILRLSLTNNGTENGRFIEMIGGTSIKAVFDDKYEYKISITMIDGDLSNESVPPLSDISGFTVIEMPDKVVEAAEGLQVKFELEGDKAVVNLR